MVARSKILMIDYDPGATIHTPTELLDIIYGLVPALRSTAHVWGVSTSSCLFNKGSKKEICGVKGQRIYIVVTDGTDIPRAAKVLVKRSWLAGHGLIKLSKAGWLLTRTILDEQVFQTNRIDYCAPAICVTPLVQKKPEPKLLGDPSVALDTRITLPDLTPSEEAQYEKLVAMAKQTREGAAATIRATYSRGRVAELIERGIDPDVASAAIASALETSLLHAAFVLTTEAGEKVCVGDLLANPAKWHGTNFADPLEPDYHDDHRIARAFLTGTRTPHIHSFAHGPHTYYLAPTVPTIQRVVGGRNNYMEDMVREFVERGMFYRRANVLVAIGDDLKLIEQNEQLMLAAMDRTFRFEHWRGEKWCVANALLTDAKHLVNAYVHRFPELRTVITAPIMVPLTGRIIDTTGYDVETKLYVNVPEDSPTVPAAPKMTEVLNALRTLYDPIRHFPFDGAVDESVMLSVMLTAVVRPLLFIAPAFAFTAPVQGSGKTMLMKLSLAIGGCSQAVSPQPDARSDDEMRKRLFASLRGDSGAIVIDNITGDYDSAALASLITTEPYSDRVLGSSITATVSTAALVLLSGNNIVFKGDLRRRVFPCRIDPGQEDPYRRKFPFDPVAIVLADRPKYVAAVLTILKAYSSLAEKREYATGGTGFKEWDDLVREAVCWLPSLQDGGVLPKESGAFWRLTDPAEAINHSQLQDPAQAAHARFVQTWATTIGCGISMKSTGSNLIQFAHASFAEQSMAISSKTEGLPATLKDVFIAVAGNFHTQDINPHKLDNYLSSILDRVVDGFCVRRGTPYQHAATWYVERVEVPGEFGESISNQSENLKMTEVQPNVATPSNLTKLTPPGGGRRPRVAANEDLQRPGGARLHALKGKKRAA